MGKGVPSSGHSTSSHSEMCPEEGTPLPHHASIF